MVWFAGRLLDAENLPPSLSHSLSLFLSHTLSRSLSQAVCWMMGISGTLAGAATIASFLLIAVSSSSLL